MIIEVDGASDCVMYIIPMPSNLNWCVGTSYRSSARNIKSISGPPFIHNVETGIWAGICCACVDGEKKAASAAARISALVFTDQMPF